MIPKRILENADWLEAKREEGEVPIFDWQVGDWAVYAAGQDGNGYFVVTSVRPNTVMGYDTFIGGPDEYTKADIWPASHDKLAIDYLVHDWLKAAEKAKKL